MVTAEERLNVDKANWRVQVKAYIELLKLRLSGLVGFSGAVGFMLASKEQYSVLKVILFVVSGLLITGAANATNQVLEIELDKLMKRTGQRPLPSGRLTKRNAQLFIAVLLFAGLTIQAVAFNPLTASLSFLSFLLYGFAYTPLKRVGPIAVFVGAIPGALPTLIGWVAATGAFSEVALVLFAQQLVWQFPHFWAIAWVLDEDYKRAGFNLLPLQKVKSLENSIIVLLFTIMLLPIGWLPYSLGLTGLVSAWIATGAGLLFLLQNIKLVQEGSDLAARKLMFGSFIYLPIVQIGYLIDKL
jgi:heme o synthase